MISSITIQRRKDLDGKDYWELKVLTMDQESAERLAEPIIRELNEDIEINEIINE